MAEGGDFGYEDKALDKKIDNDGWDDERKEANTTKPFEPYFASTPYKGREKIEMQRMQHEQSGLPDTSFEETPLLSGSIRDADIERRLRALRLDPLTGIINTSQMMDTSINPLSEEDNAEQIERVKRFIKNEYPKAKLDDLVFAFSRKKPMDIVVLGPKGGEEKVVKNDGSGLQKRFLNVTYVQRALGPSSREIINQEDIHIRKRQKELESGRVDELNQQQNLKSKYEEIQGVAQRIEKEEAKIEQRKENQLPGYEEEMKRKEQLLKNLKKDLKTKQKEREELQKKSKKAQEKNDKLQSSISEEERKRNELEKKFYDTKNFDVLKEEIIHLKRLNEEDQAIIQDEMATSLEKEAAGEREAARNERIACLETQLAEIEATMPLREKVREIFKKYGVTVIAIFLAIFRNRGCCWGDHQRFEIHGQSISKWP